MTTLKDKIRDLVMEYHSRKDSAPEPSVLVEEIIEIVNDEILGFMSKTTQ